MLFQIPYNFRYSSPIMNFVEQNVELIHSIYFGFGSSSRTIKHDTKSLSEHVQCLTKLKNKGIALAYVLNQVTDFDGFDKYDEYFLDSNLVDILILSQDRTYEILYDKYGQKFAYEASLFYFYLNNNDLLLKKSSIIAFGFKHELDEHYEKVKKINPNIYLSFIANENCYDKCEFKIEHNSNQNKRNKGFVIEKFNCPYLDKRSFYSEEDVQDVCSKYPVDILKICDRAFDDETLMLHMKRWIK